MKMQNSIVDSDCVRGLELGLFVLKAFNFPDFSSLKQEKQ